jgi:(E)-4-hydroxy-3-methylbut-2-enyl-diphosphate synthase
MNFEMITFLNYHRRKTRVVYVGDVGVGGDNPIRVQSMTIADTMDTAATVKEIVQLVEAGCEIVRVTAPSIHEAENLKNIRAELTRRGIKVPLVADIHFTPNAALIAAEYVEKVRINPGNYADKKKFEQREYSDDEYERELQRIEVRFKPLVLKCKALGRSMRIGTNHGSLSDRIMNRYGDTPEGMVESALEFVRICQKYDYHDLILSMKSSNPQVAIQAYRLLAARMDDLGMDYPFHLGVTEAGDGEEGRIKSAVGIGALLEDGLGDTIRVSLTEDSVYEVPVAFRLVKKFNELAQVDSHQKHAGMTAGGDNLNGTPLRLPDPFTYKRRDTIECDLIYHRIGKGNLHRVELSLDRDLLHETNRAIDTISPMLGNNGNGRFPIINSRRSESELKCEAVHIYPQTPGDLSDLSSLRNELWRRGQYVPFAVDVTSLIPILNTAPPIADRVVFRFRKETCIDDVARVIQCASQYGLPIEWQIEIAFQSDLNSNFLSNVIEKILSHCDKADYWNILFSLSGDANGTSVVQAYRFLAGRLDALGANLPILLRYSSDAPWDNVLLDASAQLGSLLCDGIGDAIHIEADAPPENLLRLSYNILQATRQRISKTEFISCPSCGRTLFNLQTTTERIKSKTSHLKGVKIAIMGCIVNGPGEMADADFGYVGAGPQKVNLFVGKECVVRHIPEDDADARLIELIKSHGKWVEP